MLTYFSVTNFKGFNIPLSFNFKAKEYTFNSAVISNGFVKNALIYGKNGTGKSSLGFALFDLISHLTDKVFFNEEITKHYKNLDNPPETPVQFEYHFELCGANVIYTYAKQSVHELLHESLKINNRLVVDFDFTSQASKKRFVDRKVFPLLNIDLPDNHLSVLKYLYRNLPSNTVSELTALFNFCENMLWYRSLSRGNTFAGFQNSSETLSKILYKANALDQFKKFLLENDLNYNLHFELRNNEPTLVADFKNGSAIFDVIASTGTNALYLFFAWSLLIEKASFVFIDEFDAFFHFEAARSIVKRLNELQCQTIVTSHNTYLMRNDLTRPDCCFILTNQQLRSLAECTSKELRQAHNLEKMYTNGAFNE